MRVAIGSGMTLELGDEWSVQELQGLDAAFVRSSTHGVVLHVRREGIGAVDPSALIERIRSRGWASDAFDERLSVGAITVASALFAYARERDDVVVLEIFGTDGRAVANAATFGPRARIEAARDDAERLLRSVQLTR